MFEIAAHEKIGDITVVKATPLHPYLFMPLSCYDSGARDRVARNVLDPSTDALALISPDNQCLGVVGGTFTFDHSMTYWALFGEHIRKYPKGLHKTLIHYIQDFINFYKLKRVQTFVDSDNIAAIRHNEKLGFTKEGLLRKFGPGGKDQYIFAMVR